MSWGREASATAQEGTDGVLVARTRAGDHDAFAALVGRYQEQLRQVIQSRVRWPEVAEDLVQEVFCKAYQKLPALADDELVSHWLARMAANAAVQWQRDQQAWRQVKARPWMVPSGASPRQPDELLEVREEWDQVEQALARLSAVDRQVVELFYLEGCTCREISLLMGVARDTVKGRLWRVRRWLRQELALAD